MSEQRDARSNQSCRVPRLKMGVCSNNSPRMVSYRTNRLHYIVLDHRAHAETHAPLGARSSPWPSFSLLTRLPLRCLTSVREPARSDYCRCRSTHPHQSPPLHQPRRSVPQGQHSLVNPNLIVILPPFRLRLPCNFSLRSCSPALQRLLGPLIRYRAAAVAAISPIADTNQTHETM